jgi:tRNA nucleotidyltransferase/poly(A) polymerase
MRIRKFKDFVLNESLNGNRIPFDIDVPNDIVLIKKVFDDNKYELFLVGGSVRDAIQGKSPKDWDLVTNATPDKVIEILKKQEFVRNILETGKSFGVVNILTKNDEYEIATFRTDSDSSDSRRPDSVEFTDIEGDYKRRDLTINSLYYDIDTKEVIDFVGGVDDIRNGVIKTVGNPDDRFDEDALRRLRSIRFAARFGSSLDSETDKSLKKNNSLEKVSVERIRDEFLKGIKSAKSVIYFLQLLDEYDMFKYIFRGVVINKEFIEERDPYVLITWLLHNNANIENVLGRMTYTLKEIKIISFLSKLSILSINSIYPLKKEQSLSGCTDDQIRVVGELFKIDKKLINTFLIYRITTSGQEVMSLGFKGADIGREIERLELEKIKKLYEEV